MQWKKVFCAILIMSPAGVFAQKNLKPVTDGKQLALLEAGSINENVVIASGSKTVRPDSLVTQQFIKASGSAKAKPAATASEAGTEEESDHKFKPVPLIGQLDYYGKMNNYLISYCKSYMSNFSNRLNKVNSKEETFAVMDEILAKYGIPKELKYLAVIESALNGNARSRAGAVGYWQFMAPTARRMGLTVNRHRDDRKNLYKSTKAAAKYLSYLYSKTDDWLLTIAAYNSGLRPVLDAINRTGENDFWSIKKYLPKETQNHVLAFVATATIMERLNPYLDEGLPTDFDWASLNNKDEAAAKAKEPADNTGAGSIKHDLSRFSKEELQKMAIIRIKKPLSLAVVSSILSIDRNLLSRWNYDYYSYATAFKDGDTYNLRIPKDKLDEFIEKINIIENSRINNNY